MGKCSAGACPPLGPGAGHGRMPCANSPHKIATPVFHTLVCRPLPAWAIAKKMTLREPKSAREPRLPHSSFRPFIRHSGEGRNPEGWGWEM